MKKRHLKKWVKVVLIASAVGIILIGFKHKSIDEFGNTCYGGIIKVCGR